jgi:FKBP-type peptidyl-prolyl isomerase-like protein
MRNHQKMRSGIEILEDQPGHGPPIERRHVYRVRLRMWLNQGEPIRWQSPWGLLDGSALEDGGHTLITCLRVDRRSMVNGLFYGTEGMRIGGTRKLKISPHLAYSDKGVAGVIPANAVLIAEIAFLEERLDQQSRNGDQIR